MYTKYRKAKQMTRQKGTYIHATEASFFFGNKNKQIKGTDNNSNMTRR